MKIALVVILVALFTANIVLCETVSHEVLLEKLNNLSVSINDIKVSIDKKGIQRDLERSEQKEINKLQDSTIQSIQLIQTEQAVKINIIWGVLGTAIGGTGVYSGMRVVRKRNGNVKEVK